ncbi:GNAT family N-acetyltransferase [Microlunatus endophyticus]
MPDLMNPDVRFHASFVTAMDEEPGMVAYLFRGDEETLVDPGVFAGYVAQLIADQSEESPRPEGFVPGTTLWWVDGDEFLGRIAVRHRLTEQLRRVGGHIGYWIRPSARRKGHATAAFRAALPIAYELGIDPALVTCDEDNVGSRRIIEAAGAGSSPRSG